MPFWPFRREESALTPEQVRDRLIAAASGPKRKLRTLCERHKAQVLAHLDLLRKIPPDLTDDPAALDDYMQRLGAVAHCLATECGSPELWNSLTGTDEDDPFLQWERWLSALPERMERLEHDALIAEARSHLEAVRAWRGRSARRHEAFRLGRLGELFFHSGRVPEAIEPLREALAICREIGDAEGEAIYLNNLLETHRYCGEIDEAALAGEELIAMYERRREDAKHLKRRVERLRRGEPLCRIVCVHDGSEFELDELSGPIEGRIEFRIQRNRPSLQKSEALVRRGNDLASAGRLADALSKYQEASEVDPYDPDPSYQGGICLMELGIYAKSRESFERVERLAPGWYRCRSDRWLADALDDGTVSHDEFQLLRALEDGGLAPDAALELAVKAVERHPEFAPFHLMLGNLRLNRAERDSAVRSFRQGLELAAEPDLESRLRIALAGLLPTDSSERKDLIERAVELNGSLVAQATARLMSMR